MTRHTAPDWQDDQPRYLDDGIKPDGGPAFPNEIIGSISKGMSLRDWFAGQALLDVAGVNPSLPGDKANTGAWPSPDELAMRRAVWAYLQADAMLTARLENHDE